MPKAQLLNGGWYYIIYFLLTVPFLAMGLLWFIQMKSFFSAIFIINIWCEVNDENKYCTVRICLGDNIKNKNKHIKKLKYIYILNHDVDTLIYSKCIRTVALNWLFSLVFPNQTMTVRHNLQCLHLFNVFYLNILLTLN